MSKPVILTGLRANKDLHIGNYLGALLPMIDIARQKAGDYQINLFVPDLHSFTTPIDHTKLQTSIIETVRTYLALGFPVEHTDVHVYRQSYISAHSELTWILSCFTGVGEMGRMTQFKEKSGKIYDENSGAVNELRESDTHTHTVEQAKVYEYIKSRVSVGLFSYPILMAADILLYQATYVPVGDDQAQHLEFTRDIAERMNSKFGELFTVPEPVQKQHEFFGKDQGLRIRDLADPSKKMSKSDDTGKGVIFLSDTPESATKKIMSATTDSLENIQYDYETRPGISNLLDILELFGGDKRQFIGQTQYGPLKSAVSEAVRGFLAAHQAKLAEISPDHAVAALEQGESTVRPVAQQTLLRIQQEVGLRPNKN